MPKHIFPLNNALVASLSIYRLVVHLVRNLNLQEAYISILHSHANFISHQNFNQFFISPVCYTYILNCLTAHIYTLNNNMYRYSRK